MSESEMITLVQAHKILLDQGIYDSNLDEIFEALRNSEHKHKFFKICDALEV